MKVYEAIADATVAEGVDTVFAVMGDGNMGILMRLRERGVRIVYARHEANAVAMAEGYARASGRLTACSVTCGPGLTFLATGMVIASRARTPLIILAGDHPHSDPFYNQALDQRRFVEACEAYPVRLDNPATLARELAEAFFLTATHGPVVLSAPFDIQESLVPDAYLYSSFRGKGERPAIRPEVGQLAAAVEAIRISQRPLIIVGQGGAHAAEAVTELAEVLDARLATSLMALGLFEDNPRNLGLSGGFARDDARRLFALADCVVAIGASLNQYTTAYGSLFPDATLIQIDREPYGLVHGRRRSGAIAGGLRPPDVYVQAEAAAAVAELLDAFRPAPKSATWPEAQLEPRALTPLVEAADRLDPRVAMTELGRLAPPDALFVIGLGHYWWFATTFLGGRSHGSYQFTSEFGSIGQGLPSAIGTALARPDRTVVLVEGDGSLMMSVQEIDTAVRAGARLLIVVVNDHGLGAEFHKLDAKGFDSSDARIAPPDFATVAAAFGAEGTQCASAPQIADALARLGPAPGVRLIDVLVSPEEMSEPYRRALAGVKEVAK